MFGCSGKQCSRHIEWAGRCYEKVWSWLEQELVTYFINKTKNYTGCVFASVALPCSSSTFTINLHYFCWSIQSIKSKKKGRDGGELWAYGCVTIQRFLLYSSTKVINLPLSFLSSCWLCVPAAFFVAAPLQTGRNRFTVVKWRPSCSYTAWCLWGIFQAWHIGAVLPVTCNTPLLDSFPALFSAVQVYVPAASREHRIRSRTATPFLNEVLSESTFLPKWQDSDGQIGDDQ